MKTQAARRADEVHFLLELVEVTAQFGILRIGRFVPGTAVYYAGCYVLRLVNGQFVTQLALFEDDRGLGSCRFTFHCGHYFFADDADGETGQWLEVAVSDLNAR